MRSPEERNHIVVQYKISRSLSATTVKADWSGAGVVKVGLRSGFQDCFESSNKDGSHTQPEG